MQIHTDMHSNRECIFVCIGLYCCSEYMHICTHVSSAYLHVSDCISVTFVQISAIFIRPIRPPAGTGRSLGRTSRTRPERAVAGPALLGPVNRRHGPARVGGPPTAVQRRPAPGRRGGRGGGERVGAGPGGVGRSGGRDGPGLTPGGTLRGARTAGAGAARRASLRRWRPPAAAGASGARRVGAWS